MTTPDDRAVALQAAMLEAASMNTATLNLGRFTPQTARQRESALAGIAQCDADWTAGELTTSDDMIRQGRDPYWKAGYEIRWLEHAATLPKQQAVASTISGDALAMIPAAGDETARVLAEHGTPEKLLDYLLMEAERRKREAHAAAWAQCGADGMTPAAKERYDAAYWAAYDQWVAEAASLTSDYARAIGATAPAASSDDPASPYNKGRRDGSSMHVRQFAGRRASYDDSRWSEYVAGLAEAVQVHADEVERDARAFVRQAPAPPRETGRVASNTSVAAGTGATVRFPGAVSPADPGSAEYARDYNNGWRASERYLLSGSYQVLTPLERADQRNVSNGWYDGYYDHAADRPKWTYQQARLAGFDSAEDYLITRAAEASDSRADLLGGPPIDVPDHVVVGGHSARLASDRQGQVAPRPAEFPHPVQPAAPLSARTGQRAAATGTTASPAAHSGPRGPR